MVVTDADEIAFEDQFPLMAVDFVRNGQYTVVPFPFKYLREYAKMDSISVTKD